MVRRGRECSVAEALEVVGERWSLLALREIMLGERRFNQIAENTGASRDILAARLRKLIDAGVLEKIQYEAHPPRHEYYPTEAGRALQPILLGLMAWGDKYVHQGEPPTLWRHACGEVLRPATVCAHCGEPVNAPGTEAIRLGAVHS
ncbi:helix-turn-helix transcriptional regulator [Amycolatopsis sp. OK19-0408]|uniref:Helix-turn-helix transcriptional regulator n=1 Tax=Amycolatopsis iheyensis TaxID=2945988 RepID=A0A9X2SHI1_9PSEU|nr:helix-turn-helix domain-containing protein [Amycolatopsis iheyensis]MCR6482409.1 helix-turn-helix transcriptional regulator [Amycolatopsis iheyensis]